MVRDIGSDPMVHEKGTDPNTFYLKIDRQI